LNFGQLSQKRGPCYGYLPPLAEDVGRRAINRARSRTRARGKHPFHVVKQLWGVAKVRYRGIAKNLARAFSLFARANPYLVRRQLLPPQTRYVP
jgi:hypothetical protein